MESLAAAFPAISTQLAALAKRQSEVESQMIQGGRVSVLAAPLGGHATGGLSAPFNSKPKSMLTEMPPPRTLQSPPPLPVRAVATESLNPASKPVEVIALEGEGEASGSDLAQAVLAQSRCFLPQRMSERGEEDVSLPKLRSAAHGAVSSWSERHRISGEVWRFWEEPGLGTDCLASVDADGPSTSRQPSSSKGFSGSPSSVPRAGVYGCRTSRHWTSSIAGGRSPIRGVHQQELGTIVEGEEFCTTGGAALDFTGALLYQGARHDHAEMSRLGVISKGGTSAGCSPYSKDKGQGSCKAQSWKKGRKAQEEEAEE